MNVRSLRERVRSGDWSELALVVTFLVAIPVSLVHWGGLVVGGALVGVVARSLPRALVLGFVLGLTVLLVFAGWLLLAGVFGSYLSMGMVFLASVGVSLGLPLLAAGAARGLT